MSEFGPTHLFINGTSTSVRDIQETAALLMVETGEPRILEAARRLRDERNAARERYLLGWAKR